MEEMLIINPRASNGRFTKSRRRHKNSRKRRRNPIAAASNPRRRRRRNPIAAAVANPRRRRRRNPIAAAVANPRRRRHRAVGYTVGSRRIRRRKMNPISVGSFKPRAILNALIPAGIGAVGAIALDVGLSYIPLPASMQSATAKNVAKLLGSIALGIVGGMVLGRQRGQQIALGALTVTSYTVIRDLVKTNFPQLNLAGAEQYDYSDLRIGYTNPAAMLTGSGVGAYMPSSMGVPAAGIGAYMGRGSLDTVNGLSGVVGDGM